MEAVTQEELWELADRLSSSHAVGNTARDVDSLAEAFGVDPAVVRQELAAIRGEDDLARLRAENARLKQQIATQSSRPADPVWLNEQHESTTINGEYIETVRIERSRQPTWTVAVALIIFIVVALIMFRAVSSPGPRTFQSRPEIGLQFPGGEPPSGVRKMFEEQMRERR